MTKRLYPIESIRAFACIGVLLCHFKGAFFPNSSIVAWMMKTPLNIIFSGNTPVRLMFIISGLVISYKYFSRKCYEEVPKDVFKRYFRLGIPVFVTCLFAHVLMRFGWMKNIETAAVTNSVDFLGIFNNFGPNIALCLKEGVYGVLFTNSNAYVGPMWTMTYEMLGSLMILCAVALFHNNVKLRVAFYIVFLLVYQNYYTYFVIGMMIADFICHSNYQKEWTNKKEWICNILLLITGIYVCNPAFIDGSSSNFWKFTIACLIMFPCFLQSSIVNKFLGKNNKLCLWMGKNSYAIYLLHWPIMESVSCWLFLKLYTICSYNVACLITLFVTIIIVLVAAECFNRIVEKAAGIICDNMTKVIFVSE